MSAETCEICGSPYEVSGLSFASLCIRCFAEFNAWLAKKESEKKP